MKKLNLQDKVLIGLSALTLVLCLAVIIVCVTECLNGMVCSATWIGFSLICMAVAGNEITKVFVK